jgi:hypothetical protein
MSYEEAREILKDNPYFDLDEDEYEALPAPSAKPHGIADLKPKPKVAKPIAPEERKRERVLTKGERYRAMTERLKRGR